jgi:hypothetical protein
MHFIDYYYHNMIFTLEQKIEEFTETKQKTDEYVYIELDTKCR